MIKGKAYDMKGDYAKASEVFEKNLKDYIKMVNCTNMQIQADGKVQEI